MATVTLNTSREACEMQQTFDHCALEMAYEKTLHQTSAVYDEELARQLRMQILLLEDENDQLEEQIARDEDRIDELEGIGEERQQQLDEAHDDLESVQSEIRLKAREIETLKVELRSLHDVTMNSTKLLTEKLSLTRELSSLKPEIDHLRSQAASQQDILAEKLSLQRQLSTLQAELELEKRSTQRAIAKEEKAQAQDTKLATQLEELKAELAKERKERQRIEREAQKTATEWENKKTTLESRLDAFRTKLKSTKDQLKDTQTELQRVEANATKITSKDARKRTAARMEDDTMIGTPGDLRAAKKTKRASTLPGDKSTFSITPFLNRTASVAPESPAEESDGPEEVGDEDAGDATEPEPTKTKERQVLSKASESPSGRGRPAASEKPIAKPSVLAKAKPSKTNAKVPAARKPKQKPTLEQVAEEIDDENVVPTRDQPFESLAGTSVGESTEVETKKRKRKLLGGGLGRTLFDDDDAEADKPGRFGNRGAFNFQRVNLGRPKAGSRLGFSGDMSGFGSFSPLKKDRKANAS